MELAVALEKMVNEKLPNLLTLGDCGGSGGSVSAHCGELLDSDRWWWIRVGIQEGWCGCSYPTIGRERSNRGGWPRTWPRITHLARFPRRPKRRGDRGLLLIT